jgi:hypothetical protein
MPSLQPVPPSGIIQAQYAGGTIEYQTVYHPVVLVVGGAAIKAAHIGIAGGAKELRQNKFSKSGIDDSLWIVP